MKIPQEKKFKNIEKKMNLEIISPVRGIRKLVQDKLST